MARISPTNEQIFKWYDELSNWGRWGKDDLMGTLNLITPQKRLQAGALIKEGINVSCAYPIRFNEHNLDDGHPEPRHYMTNMPPAELAPDFVGNSGSGDIVVLNCHGLTLTHLDSPSHYLFKPSVDRPLTGFNGLPRSVITPRGIERGAVTLAGGGIVSRGVLLDIARLRNVDWLEPGTPIFPEDLEEAEAKTGHQSGTRRHPLHPHRTRGSANGPRGGIADRASRPGLMALAYPGYDRGTLRSWPADTANDWIPKPETQITRPIHCIGIPGIGMWLIDGADYEELGEHCARLNRWEFMLVIPPLKLNGGTASPVNPIAIL